MDHLPGIAVALALHTTRCFEVRYNKSGYPGKPPLNCLAQALDNSLAGFAHGFSLSDVGHVRQSDPLAVPTLAGCIVARGP